MTADRSKPRAKPRPKPRPASRARSEPDRAPALPAAAPAPSSLVSAVHADGRPRCAWCGTDPLYVRYHDEEWGRPVHDERHLFEMLCLEGAQAGLSWITILRKRAQYRRAFDAFDPVKIARYTERRIEKLMADAGIVRNRLKIRAFIENARALNALHAEGRTLDALVWSHAPQPGGRRRPSAPGTFASSSPESDAMSRALKAAGFKFIGTTICYAFMQAVGIVDDHAEGCWCAKGFGVR